jgi:hypothetical protein
LFTIKVSKLDCRRFIFGIRLSAAKRAVLPEKVVQLESASIRVSYKEVEEWVLEK